MFWKVQGLVALLCSAALIACGSDPETEKLEAVRRGDAYIASNTMPEAILEYRKALQLDPLLGDVRLKLAEAYANAGNVHEAYREYIRAADLLPENVQAQLKAAGVLIAAQQFEDAQTRVNSVLARDPDNVDAQILRATALAGLKRIDQAVEEVEELLRRSQNDGRAYPVLGQLQTLRGNREAAEAAFLQAIERDSRSLPARLGLINFYWAADRPADAEKQLKAVFDIEPRNLIVNRAFAAFLIRSGRVSEAEPYLRTVAELSTDGTGKLVLADYYSSQNRPDEARSILEPLAQPDLQTFAAAKLRLATLEAAGGSVPVALGLINEIVKAEPANVDALVLKARLLTGERKLDEALNAARAAAQADPMSAAAQFVLGRTHRQRGETADAITAFARAVQLDPQMTAAEIELGELQLNAGRVDQAEPLARSAAAKAPNAPEAQLLLARVELRAGNLIAAERTLSSLSKANPKSAAIQTELGRLQIARKNVSGARATFQRVLAGNPSYVDALAELTRIDLQGNRADAARTRVEQALERSPRDSALLLVAARTYADLRDQRSAETALQTLIEVEPQRAEGYALLGQLYAAQGKTDLALNAFQRLAARQPNLASAHVAMGRILQEQNRRDEAKEAYRRAVSIDASAIVPANHLAFMYAEDNERLDEALQLAQAAKARLPNEPEIANTLGYVYFRKGMFGPAVTALKEAVDKRPDAAAFRYHLGFAYAKNGDNGLARKTLELALKLDSNAREAAEARAVLAELATLGS